MKRIIVAASLAVLTLPAFAATSLPYEQLEVDRALPQVNVPTDQNASSGASTRKAGAPFEQTQFDRNV